MFYISINESCPEFLCRLTHATFLEAAVFPYDQQDAGRELVDEKLINGDKQSWPVLVGLLDSFGVRNISTGTLGPCLRWICEWFVWYELWRFLRTSSQVVLGSGISTLLQVILVTVWQCNLNGDKLDFRVVNPVFSGDFIARILDSGTEQSVQQQ